MQPQSTQPKKTPQSKQKPKKPKQTPTPLNLHIIDINTQKSKPMSKHKPNKSVDYTNMYLNGKKQCQQIRKTSYLSHRYIMKNNGNKINRKKEKIDQFSFSDYRLKFGSTERYLHESRDTQESQIQPSPSWSHSKPKCHQTKPTTFEEFKQHVLIMPQQKKSTEISKLENGNRRKIMSHVEKRSYLPNIRNIQNHKKIYKFYEIPDAEKHEHILKIEGWNESPYHYEIDRKHDIIEYISTRAQSRGIKEPIHKFNTPKIHEKLKL